jgi:hypothetical protein
MKKVTLLCVCMRKNINILRTFSPSPLRRVFCGSEPNSGGGRKRKVWVTWSTVGDGHQNRQSLCQEGRYLRCEGILERVRIHPSLIVGLGGNEVHFPLSHPTPANTHRVRVDSASKIGKEESKWGRKVPIEVWQLDVLATESRFAKLISPNGLIGIETRSWQDQNVGKMKMVNSMGEYPKTR